MVYSLIFPANSSISYSGIWNWQDLIVATVYTEGINMLGKTSKASIKEVMKKKYRNDIPEFKP